MKFKVQLVQTVAILREGDAGVPVAEILRKHDISSATYHNWKAGLAMRQI
ncbi:MAG: transposase [Steroidobacteraceae bacterium]